MSASSVGCNSSGFLARPIVLEVRTDCPLVVIYTVVLFLVVPKLFKPSTTFKDTIWLSESIFILFKVA